MLCFIVATKPKKPYDDFPLYAHAAGVWAKRIRGKIHYFGPWSKPYDALDKYIRERDDLYAGRVPVKLVAKSAVTVHVVSNAFLSHKESLRVSGEITQRTYDEYYATCLRLLSFFGDNQDATGISPAMFGELRASIAAQWGPVRLGNEIQRVRSVFKFAAESGLIGPVLFGPAFRKPSAKVMRLNRAVEGGRAFTREELTSILAECGPNMRAMVLLGCNGGLGNADVAGIPLTATKQQWIVYPRQKTGIVRRIPLWPETLKAMRAAARKRRKPMSSEDKGLLFIGSRGQSYQCNNGYRVCQEFTRVVAAANIKRRGFYALRHTFQTVAEGCHDIVAVRAIMGHAPSAGDMSAVYRDAVSDERLLAATEYVRAWLFGQPPAVRQA